jgi:hypothetical protein
MDQGHHLFSQLSFGTQCRRPEAQKHHLHSTPSIDLAGTIVADAAVPLHAIAKISAAQLVSSNLAHKIQLPDMRAAAGRDFLGQSICREKMVFRGTHLDPIQKFLVMLKKFHC